MCRKLAIVVWCHNSAIVNCILISQTVSCDRYVDSFAISGTTAKPLLKVITLQFIYAPVPLASLQSSVSSFQFL